jgi:hypothetical protein
MSDNPTGRITSENIRIEFFPRSDAAITENHVQHFYFDSAVDGGTFKLWVNGEVTAAITFSATEATLITNVNAALDALPNLDAAELVLSGAASTDMTLTSTPDKYYRIFVFEDNLTQTTPNTNDHVLTEVTQQGTQQIVLSAQASSFNWEGQSETVDMTAISEYDRIEVPVALAVNWEINLYKADETWEFAIYSGTYGTFRVYPEDKIVGREYFQFRGLIETVGEDYPDHEKVERTISGMRQGDWHVPPNTEWRG